MWNNIVMCSSLAGMKFPIGLSPHNNCFLQSVLFLSHHLWQGPLGVFPCTGAWGMVCFLGASGNFIWKTLYVRVLGPDNAFDLLVFCSMTVFVALGLFVGLRCVSPQWFAEHFWPLVGRYVKGTSNKLFWIECLLNDFKWILWLIAQSVPTSLAFLNFEEHSEWDLTKHRFSYQYLGKK